MPRLDASAYWNRSGRPQQLGSVPWLLGPSRATSVRPTTRHPYYGANGDREGAVWSTARSAGQIAAEPGSLASCLAVCPALRVERR